MEQDPININFDAIERKCAYMISLPGNKITGFDYITTGSTDTAYYSVQDGRIGLTEKLTQNLYKNLTTTKAESALEAALTHEAVHSLATKYMFDPKEIVSYENFIFQRLEDCRINQISISLQPHLIPAFEDLYGVLLSARPPTPESNAQEEAMFKKPTGLQLHRLISQISEHSYEPNFALRAYVIRDQMKLDKEAYEVSEVIIPKIIKLAAMHPDPFDPTYTNNISLQSLLAIRSVITDLAPHILLDEMKKLEKEMRDQKRPSIKDLIKELEDEIKRREPPAPPQPPKTEPEQKKDQTQPGKSEPKDQKKSQDKQDPQPKDSSEKKQADEKAKPDQKDKSEDKEQADQGEPEQGEGKDSENQGDQPGKQGEPDPSAPGDSPNQDGKPSDSKQPGQKGNKPSPSKSDQPGQPGTGKDGEPTNDNEPSNPPSKPDANAPKSDQPAQGTPSAGDKDSQKPDSQSAPKPAPNAGDKQPGAKPEPSKEGTKGDSPKPESTQEKADGPAAGGKEPPAPEQPMPATSPLPSIKDLSTDQLKQLKEALEKMQEEDMPGQSSIGEDGKETPEDITTKSEKELKGLPDPTKPSANPFPGSAGYSTAQAKPTKEATEMVGALEYSAFITKYYPTVSAASRLFSNMDDRADQSGPARIKSSTQGPLLHTKNIAKFTTQGPTGELPPFFKAPNSTLAKGRRIWKLEKMFISIDGSSSMSDTVPFVRDLLGITYEAARKAGIPVAATVAYDGQPTILSKGTFADKPSEVIMKMLALSVRGGTNISEGSLRSLVENKGRTVPKGGRLIMLTDCETSEEDLTLIGRYAKELDYPALIISVGNQQYSAKAAQIFKASDNCTIRANYQDRKGLSPESNFFRVFSQWMKDPDQFKRQYGHYADTESLSKNRDNSSYDR